MIESTTMRGCWRTSKLIHHVFVVLVVLLLTRIYTVRSHGDNREKEQHDKIRRRLSRGEYELNYMGEQEQLPLDYADDDDDDEGGDKSNTDKNNFLQELGDKQQQQQQQQLKENEHRRRILSSSESFYGTRSPGTRSPSKSKCGQGGGKLSLKGFKSKSGSRSPDKLSLKGFKSGTRSPDEYTSRAPKAGKGKGGSKAPRSGCSEEPTAAPTTEPPTIAPTTIAPTTISLTTAAPTTEEPTAKPTTTAAPTIPRYRCTEEELEIFNSTAIECFGGEVLFNDCFSCVDFFLDFLLPNPEDCNELRDDICAGDAFFACDCATECYPILEETFLCTFFIEEGCTDILPCS